MDESTPSPPGVCAFANHYFCSPGQSHCARGFPYYHHSEEQLRAQRFGSCHCCGERLIDCVANSTCRVPRDPTVVSTPLLERFSRLLLPMPFFSGVVLGLLLCIVGGHLAARSNIYGDRSRFSSRSPPKVTSIPRWKTSSSSCGRRRRRRKILVLAAGSSISLGVGQQDNHLWTDLLQRELGDAFAVVNGSFRSAKFTSIGLPLLEILTQEYPRLLFVTESRPGYAPEWMQYDSRSPFFYPYNYLLFRRG